MSRVGNRPIALPSGVSVSLKGGVMAAKGPKGLLQRPIPSHVELEIDAEEVRVKRVNDSKIARERHGLCRALLQNMVTGVSAGFQKDLEIVGVGYKAAVQGKSLQLNLGYSHPIDFAIPDGIAISVKKNKISVAGIDCEVVGQTAATIRGFRKPDAYKGKGVRYSDERIRLKPGKAGAAAT